MATWTVKKVESYDTYDDHDQVVFRIYWKCAASEEVDNTTHSLSLDGSQGIEPAPPARFSLDPFTPYADITETQALAWLHDYIGPAAVTEIETRVTDRLAKKITPTTQSGTPWETQGPD